eukprot:s634_g26.t1
MAIFLRRTWKKRPSPDVIVSEVEMPNRAGGAGHSVGNEDDVELVSRQHRVLRHDGEHGAANDDGGRDLSDSSNPGGRDENSEEESFEEEVESPTSRYRRHMQSTTGEVSDPDEWCEIHYGFPEQEEQEEGGALTRSRWDQIMQGLGPENAVVHYCRNVPNHIPVEPDPIEQRRLQRLLRHLQSLMVKFQSNNAVLWIEAAEQVKAWLENDRLVDFFDEAPTEAGSQEGEGEEEESRETDPSEDADEDHDDQHGEGDDDEHHGSAGGYGGASSSGGGCGGLRERLRRCVVSVLIRLLSTASGSNRNVLAAFSSTFHPRRKCCPLSAVIMGVHDLRSATGRWLHWTQASVKDEADLPQEAERNFGEGKAVEEKVGMAQVEEWYLMDSQNG